MSLPAEVDLSRLVRGHSLVSAREVALTGGAALVARTQKLDWVASGDGDGDGGASAIKPEGLLSVGQEPFLRNAEEADVWEGVGEEKAEAFASSSTAEGAADGSGGWGGGNGGGGGGGGETSDEWRVTIGPMEIRTYRLEFAPETLPGRWF